MEQILDFSVIGEQTIHCTGCERRIGNALRRRPGVQDVRASAQTQRVVVTVDPAKVSPDRVQATLEQLGYAVARTGGTL